MKIRFKRKFYFLEIYENIHTTSFFYFYFSKLYNSSFCLFQKLFRYFLQIFYYFKIDNFFRCLIWLFFYYSSCGYKLQKSYSFVKRLLVENIIYLFERNVFIRMHIESFSCILLHINKLIKKYLSKKID